MSPDRAGATPPIDPSRGGHNTQNTKAQREAKQKIEKVREVDPDEQAKQQRRNQFESFLNTPEKDDTPQRTPTPYETQFHDEPTQTGGPIQKMKKQAVPTPGTTPPPNVSSSQLPQKKETIAEPGAQTGLPQSKAFWHETDLPPDMPPNQPPTAPQYKEKVKKPEVASLPLEPVVKIERRAGAPVSESRADAPVSKEELENRQPLVPKEPKKQKSARTAPKEKKHAEIAPFQPERGQDQRQGKQEDHLSKKAPKLAQLENSLLPHAPKEIHVAAQTATQHATPFLNSESAALFYQMVGTIYLSLPPGSGISQTVVVLNQAAFANSKFFGSTITIEKYATAPDALNIRLSGSNQAVVAFQENIASLMSAFENARLPFKINRIDVEYAPQRPLFRRKEAKKGKDLSGGMGDLNQ